MNKKVLIGVGVVIALGLVFSAGSSTSDDDTVTTTTNRPTTTTTERLTTTTVDQELVDCMDDAAEVAEELNSLSTSATSSSPTPSNARRLIREARSVITKGRSFIDRCGHYNPSGAGDVTDSLDALEQTTDDMEDFITIYS